MIYEAGIYRLDFGNDNFFGVGGNNAWVKNEDGEHIQVESGMELEIMEVCDCKRRDICEAIVWCPGKFRITKPFKGVFCLVFYTKKKPEGTLGLVLVRSLRWRNGKLLRRMNLNPTQSIL